MHSIFRRRTYLVNKSSQLTYVAFSVLPALVMSAFCIYFLFDNGELILKDSREKPMVPIYELQQSVAALDVDNNSPELKAEIKALKGELVLLTNNLESGYEEIIYRWNSTQKTLYLVMVSVLICVGFWSFIYSHRIAGPLYRIKKNIDELARGEDIPPVILRKNDEFQELGASLENLRLRIREQEHVNS